MKSKHVNKNLELPTTVTTQQNWSVLVVLMFNYLI